MKPIQTLPENYALAWEVDLRRDKNLNIVLQVIGTLWTLLLGYGLLEAFAWLGRPIDLGLWFAKASLPTIGMFLLDMLITITIHELVHGLWFWVFAQHRPVFGYGPGYAYAAMPAWYFPKGQYLVIGLAPLVMLTVFGLLAALLAPEWLLVPLFWGLVINAGGAIGDVYVTMRIVREADNIWVRDRGDGFEVFRPKEFAEGQI